MTSNFAITQVLMFRGLTWPYISELSYQDDPAVKLLNSLPRRKHAVIVLHNINLIVTLLSCVTLLNLVTQIWKISICEPGQSHHQHIDSGCKCKPIVHVRVSSASCCMTSILCVIYFVHDDVIKWKLYPCYWPFVLCGEFTGHRWIPRTKTSDAELWCFPWSASE